MKIRIPLTPFAFRWGLAREADGRWGRLSLGNLLLLVAVAAILAAFLVRDFKTRASRTYVLTYPVGDLLGAGGAPGVELDRLASRVQSSIPQDPWYPRTRTVTPFHLSLSLIVRDSKRGHRHVQDWIDKQRKPPTAASR